MSSFKVEMLACGQFAVIEEFQPVKVAVAVSNSRRNANRIARAMAAMTDADEARMITGEGEPHADAE